MRFQAWHIIVLIIVILLVFGAPRMPEIARSLGQSLKIFKKEIRELKDDEPGKDQGQDQGQNLH